MLNKLTERYPVLSAVKADTQKAAEEIIGCYENGGKVLLWATAEVPPTVSISQGS